MYEIVANVTFQYEGGKLDPKVFTIKSVDLEQGFNSLVQTIFAFETHNHCTAITTHVHATPIKSC